MTPEEGTQRLAFHTTPETGSFLEMLRPYQGLKEDVLADVISALRATASRISDRQLSRELASALWAISYLGRLWALAPDGMLRRNHLIDDADLEKLSGFLARFDYAVMTLLAGGGPDEAFSGTANALR